MTAIRRLTILFALAVAPAAAAAQEGGTTLEITPAAGLVLSANELGRAVRLDDGNFLALGRVYGATVLGVSGRLSRNGSSWAVRATALRKLATEVFGRWDCVGVCPDILTGSPTEVTWTAAALGIAYAATLPPADGLRATATLGLGAKRYAFEWQQARGGWGGFSAGRRHVTEPMLQLGVGAELAWRGLAVVASLEDYVSRFGEADPDGRQRPGADPAPEPAGARHAVHDLMVGLGLRFRVF